MSLYNYHKEFVVSLWVISILLISSINILYADAENLMIQEVWSEQVNNKAEIFYRGRTGDSWGDAIQISALPGENVTPVVLSDNDGAVWVVWANIQHDGSVLTYTVQKNGRWSEQKKIITGLKNNIAPCLIENISRDLCVFFSGNDGNSDDDIFGMRWFGGGWTDLSRVNKANETPDVLPYAAINNDGGLEVTWAGIKEERYKIQSAVRTETSWLEVIDPLQNEMSFSSDAVKYRERGISTYSEGEGARSLSYEILNSIRNQENALSGISGKIALTETDELYANQSAKEFIITFGDSITWDDGFGRYQKELLRLLTQDGRDVKIYNLGVAGETTVEGVIRLDQYLGNIYADFLLLLEGTNDIHFGISYQTTISNLERMLNKTIAAGVTPLISNLTPDGTSNEYNKRIVNTYNPGIKELATQKKVKLVDNYTPLVRDWPAHTDDGLHPNDSGYRIMGQTWFKALPEKTKLPVVQTGKATEIKLDEATLSALIFPNGSETRYQFEYGIDGGGLNQVSETFILEGGVPQTLVDITINDLLQHTLYNYRAKAVNENGENRGEILSFTTGDEGNENGDNDGNNDGKKSGGCFIETLYK